MRKFILLILCCTALGVAGYVGYRSYKVWKQKHLLTMARNFFAKSDGKNAMLSLREALSVNSMNVDANRMAADVLEAAHSSEALVWRNRVVELNPHSTEDRLALIRTALTWKDYAVATNALEGIGQADRKTAIYHNAAGAVSLALNRLPEARDHFQEVIRLQPNDAGSLLNLAVIDLHGSNNVAQTSARATMQQLSVNPTNGVYRSQALRELVVDAMRYNHQDAALKLSQQLELQTNATFGDNLLRLAVLQATASSQFPSRMDALEKEASTNLEDLHELTTWQEIHGQIPEGLKWLQSLPSQTRTNQPTALIIAEFQAASKDWAGMQRSLQKENWEGAEFMRHALLARAFRGQDLTDSSKNEWEQALRAASGQKTTRLALLRIASQWGWKAETEDILWTMVNQYPNEKWAAQSLAQILYSGGRTRSLMALFSQEVKATPSDINSKNNLAMVALLLDAKEQKPYDLAREVYQQSPTNSSFVATYAFSLYVQGKNADALKLMQQIKPSELENPSIAGYYGLILKATGNPEKAKVYLNWTAKSSMLPEEKKLFGKALAGV